MESKQLELSPDEFMKTEINNIRQVLELLEERLARLEEILGE